MTTDQFVKTLTFLLAWLTFYVAVSCRHQLVEATQELLLATARFWRNALKAREDPVVLSEREL